MSSGSSPAVPALILGSASPRRVALLKQLGLAFRQVVSTHEEPPAAPGASARHYALRVARGKAEAVYSQVSADGDRVVVIGADTVVSVAGAVLGKPENDEEAAAMLKRLSGRAHSVYSAVAVWGPDGRQTSDCVRTRVWMRRLSTAEIAAYVASGEPADKAGAYAIQGRGARFVERISGCYYNVVGLPLARLSAMLEDLELDFTAADSAVKAPADT